MKTAELIPVEEYLRSDYQPDRDYVDGRIQERNLGEKDHSKIQKRLTVFFVRLEESTELRVWPEQRIRVSATRFRVPDVCVTLREPEEQIFTQPPFIVIEILSPEDTLPRLMERVEDYWNFGVRNIWVIDPGARRGYVASPRGFAAADELCTEGERKVSLEVARLFE